MNERKLNRPPSVGKRNRMRIFLYVVILAFIIIGCGTDECYDNRNALPYAGFYGEIDGEMTTIQVDSIEVYGIGAPGDSVLSEGTKSISDIYLPFRIDSDTTRYVFKLCMKAVAQFNIADTVTFVYDREARFVSSACGASYVFKMRDIRNTGLLIDSVVVPGGKITNANKENIRIYFRTY